MYYCVWVSEWVGLSCIENCGSIFMRLCVCVHERQLYTQQFFKAFRLLCILCCVAFFFFFFLFIYFLSCICDFYCKYTCAYALFWRTFSQFRAISFALFSHAYITVVRIVNIVRTLLFTDQPSNTHIEHKQTRNSHIIVWSMERRRARAFADTRILTFHSHERLLHFISAFAQLTLYTI